MTLPFLLCLGILLILTAIGTPVAFSIIVSSVVYLAASGQDLALAGEQLLNGLYDNFVLLAVPLFIIAANIMNAGSITDRLLRFCMVCVGRFRGGLGHVNIVASLIFSGMSGSAVADVAGIGKLIISMMTRQGHYTAGYAAAITAASATIGPVIPPSIPIVLYALVSGESIGYLFLGGVIPGLVMGAVLMIVNALISKRRQVPLESPPPLRELPGLTVQALPAMLMPAILLYSIYGGFATPTEAAAIAALYALLISALLYRSVTLRSFYKIFVASVHSSATVGLVVGSSIILNYIVASENIPHRLAELLGGLSLNPLMFLLGINLLLLFLGAFLDSTTIILVILPLFLPTVRELGIDLVHFGVTAVINCMIGLITPPYGILLFVINAVTDIPLGKIIREVWVFIAVLIIALLLLILFPEIVLALPRRFGYEGTAF